MAEFFITEHARDRLMSRTCMSEPAFIAMMTEKRYRQMLRASRVDVRYLLFYDVEKAEFMIAVQGAEHKEIRTILPLVYWEQHKSNAGGPRPGDLEKAMILAGVDPLIADAQREGRKNATTVRVTGRGLSEDDMSMKAINLGRVWLSKPAARYGSLKAMAKDEEFIRGVEDLVEQKSDELPPLFDLVITLNKEKAVVHVPGICGINPEEANMMQRWGSLR